MVAVVFEAFEPTRVAGNIVSRAIDAVSSSESASLQGRPAKTPIIAGSICGGVMGLAWIIGFSIYFWKRAQRKKRNRLVAEGKAPPKPKKHSTSKDEVIIIPPDPAILSGLHKPGERVFPEETKHHRSASHHKSHSQSHTSQNHDPLLNEKPVGAEIPQTSGDTK